MQAMKIFVKLNSVPTAISEKKSQISNLSNIEDAEYQGTTVN